MGIMLSLILAGMVIAWVVALFAIDFIVVFASAIIEDFCKVNIFRNTWFVVLLNFLIVIGYAIYRYNQPDESAGFLGIWWGMSGVVAVFYLLSISDVC